MTAPVTGRCLVCAAPLEEPLVSCPLCDTPHHAGCFAYNMGCGRYGCGSRMQGAGVILGFHRHRWIHSKPHGNDKSPYAYAVEFWPVYKVLAMMTTVAGGGLAGLTFALYRPYHFAHPGTWTQFLIGSLVFALSLAFTLTSGAAWIFDRKTNTVWLRRLICGRVLVHRRAELSDCVAVVLDKTPSGSRSAGHWFVAVRLRSGDMLRMDRTTAQDECPDELREHAAELRKLLGLPPARAGCL